jgi:hypothetical protein
MYQITIKIPNGHKINHVAVKLTKWPQNIPNTGKIDKMALKYTNIFQSQDTPKFTRIVIFGLKMCKIWQPCSEVRNETNMCFLATDLFTQKTVTRLSRATAEVDGGVTRGTTMQSTNQPFLVLSYFLGCQGYMHVHT